MPSKIGIVLAVDGEREFTQSFANVNKSLQVSRSEAAKVKAEFEGQQNSIEALAAKHDVLAKKLQEQKEKQRIAGEAVESTKKQYDNAQKSLEDLKKELEKAKAKQDEMTRSGNSSEREMKDQEKVVAQYNAAIAKQENELSKCENKVKTWQQRLNTAEKEVIESNRALDQNAAYMKEAEQATDHCAKSIDGFGKEVKGATEVTMDWGERFKGAFADKVVDMAGNALTTIAGKAVDAGKAMVDMAVDAAAYADEILTASEVTRMSTDDLQAYSYAAELVDVSLDTLTGSMTKNVKSMDNARKGSENYVEAYKKLGVEVTEADGSLRDSETVYWECIDALQSMQDETERDAVAMQLFGKSAQDLNPLISKGSAGIKALKDEAKQMGAVLDGETLQALGNTDDSLQRLNQSTEIFKRTVGANVAPIIQGAADLATSALNGITNALTPQKTELEQFISDIEKMNSSAKSSLENAEASISSGEAEVAKLEGLADIIREANEQFGIFAEVDTSEAAGDAKETAGSISASMEGIQDDTAEAKGSIDDFAKADSSGAADNISETEAAISGSLATLGEAFEAAGESASIGAQEIDEFTKFQTKNAVEELAKTIPALADAWDETTNSLRITEEEFNNLIDNQKRLIMAQSFEKAKADAADAWASSMMGVKMAQSAVTEALKEASEVLGVDIESVEQLNNLWDQGSEVFDGVSYKIVEAANTSQEALDEANKTYEEANEEMQKVDAAAKELTETWGLEEEATEGATEAKKDAADADKELSEEEKRLAEAVENSAKRSKEAVIDAWNSMKEAASSSIKFDLFSDFDGGADQSVEELTGHLTSQIEGLRDYQENLRTISEHVGKEISPQFMAYLESLGTDGANTLEHIARTFAEDDGPEKIKQWSDDYATYLDLKDQTAGILAGDRMALEKGLKSLGSTDVEFSALKNAISAGIEGADQEAQTRIQALVDTAQEIGATLPEGLTEAINSTDISTEDIEAQLNASITGALEGLMEVAKEQGAEVPDELASGITDGTADVQDAYDQLISSISLSAGSGDAMKDAGKEAFTTPLAAGIQEGGKEVAEAVSGVSEDAAGAAKEAAPQFEAAGKEDGEQFAAGISSQNGSASSAGSSLGSTAYSAAASWQNSFYSVGVNMGQGLSQGLQSQIQQVANSAANAVKAALNAAKREAETRSPSKRFRREVGQMIGRGQALGIADTIPENERTAALVIEKAVQAAIKAQERAAKLAKNRAQKDANLSYLWGSVTNNMIASRFGVTKSDVSVDSKGNTKRTAKTSDAYNSEVLSAARDYFEQLSLYQDISTKKELEYWKKVQKQLTQGTKAYAEAAKEISNLQERADDERMRRAEQYLDKRRAANTLSTKQEIAYWQMVQKQVTKGSDAYQEASRKILNLKQQIGTADVAKSLLESYQTYYDMSELQEEQYWDKVRRKYKVGTEDRAKADQMYLEAKQKRTEKLIALEEEYQSKVQEVNAKYQDAVKERRDSILSAFNIFDAFESQSATGEELLFNMKSQAEGYEYWRKQLAGLEGRGILSKELMDELQQKGPQDTAAIVAMNSLTDDQLKEYQNAYEKRADQAQKQAESENKDLKATVSKELAQLKTDYNASVKEVNTNLNSQMKELATNLKKTAADEVTRIISAMAYGKTGGSDTAQSSAVSGWSEGSVQQSGSGSVAQGSATTGLEALDKIRLKEIINSAPTHSKKVTDAQRKSHTALWTYIVEKHGRAPTEATYKDLAAALGITMSGDKSTSGERSKILNALKKAGLSTGTKSLDDLFAWLDEEGLGSEMIVRKSDGAKLRTGLQRGDMVVPAANTDNLWEWSKVAPADFGRQQAALMDYASQMTAGIASGMQLNAMAMGFGASGSTAAGERGSSTRMVDLMQRMVELLTDGQNIVLDTGELVGGTAGKMSNELAARRRRMR